MTLLGSGGTAGQSRAALSVSCCREVSPVHGIFTHLENIEPRLPSAAAITDTVFSACCVRRLNTRTKPCAQC